MDLVAMEIIIAHVVVVGVIVIVSQEKGELL